MMSSDSLELAILFLLAERGGQKEFSMVKDIFFIDSKCKYIFKTLRSEFSKTRRMDIDIARAVLQEDWSLVLLAGGSCTFGNFSLYVEKQAEIAARREATNIAQRFSYLNSQSAFEISSDINRKLLEFQIGNDGIPSLVDTMHKALEYLSNFKPENKLSTGLEKIDKATGGLVSGRLYTLGARPNVGKTNIVTQMSMNLTDRKKKVLVFSSEMDLEELMTRRYFPMHSNIPAFKFTDPTLLDKSDIARLTSDEIVAKVTDRPLFVVEIPRPSISDIVMKIEELKPDVVIIDYLQRCQPPKAENLRISIGEMMRELKTAAKTYKIPIILVSMLNREIEGESRPPTMSDLKESGDIEQESDVIMLFYVKNPSKETTAIQEVYRKARMGNNKIISGLICKNRFGKLGSFEIVLSEVSLKTTDFDLEFNANHPESKEKQENLI